MKRGLIAAVAVVAALGGSARAAPQGVEQCQGFYGDALSEDACLRRFGYDPAKVYPAARAAWPQHADRICADFRRRYPAVKAPLAVIVHTPDAKLVDHPRYMRCAPMLGGERLPAVEAEAIN